MISVALRGMARRKLRTALTAIAIVLGVALITGTSTRYPVLRELVSGPNLDADRMDYLLRDAYFTGVASGGYDSEQLIASLRVFDIGGKQELGVDGRGVVALESFVLARYMMFASVYFHHTTRAFERVLGEVPDHRAGLHAEQQRGGHREQRSQRVATARAGERRVYAAAERSSEPDGERRDPGLPMGCEAPGAQVAHRFEIFFDLLGAAAEDADGALAIGRRRPARRTAISPAPGRGGS